MSETISKVCIAHDIALFCSYRLSNLQKNMMMNTGTLTSSKRSIKANRGVFWNRIMSMMVSNNKMEKQH
jgi:hypothetical protein